MDFPELRREIFVDEEDVIDADLVIALIQATENVCFLEEEALHVAGAGLVVELHGFLDLSESDFLLLIEQHQYAQLGCPHHQVELLVPIRKLGYYYTRAQ